MELNFSKYADGLIPAIVQDVDTRIVLMLGFMNQEAYDITIETQKVTFYSRTRKTIWTKGETSGNFLHLVEIKVDCDNDTLLVKARPVGPVCHLGTDTCWAEFNDASTLPLASMQSSIDKEIHQLPSDSELTAIIKKGGYNKLAQEVGEDALKTIIQSTNGTKEGLITCGADLLYHYMALLSAYDIRIENIIKELNTRLINKS